MSHTWASLRAHRGAMVGPGLALALAGTLLSATGVLVESDLRAGADAPAPGLLTSLALSFGGTALMVVVLVVAATVTLSMRQRRREFALLRAIGATRAQVRRTVSRELVLLTALAAPVGALGGLAVARSVRPLLTDAGVVDDTFRFAVSPLPVLVAVALLLPVAVAAARISARETLRLPPTAAVRATGVDERAVGRVRRLTAVALAGTGLAAATSALLLPGLVGSATAATSALLLVGAAGVAGPLLVTWVLDHTTAASRRLRDPAVRMALANSRGFSWRLTAAVVPLAAALALGTIQSSADRALADAAVEQLRDGLHADLVVWEPAGLEPTEVAALRAADGVERATPIGSVVAQVRVDEEEVPGLAALSWESVGIRVLPDGRPDPAYDPRVVDGSLAALAEPGTIAVSTDAHLETGSGVGDRVPVRLGDGPAIALRVVAVHERGLGFGSYLIGAATLAEHGLTAPVDTVLLTTSGPVGELDHRALRPATYAAEAGVPGPQLQRLSMVLLLGLLVFVGLGAANALVMSTANRREELRLLARTGATRRQLVTMAAAEAVVVALVAWAIGTVAVAPAVIGVSLGLLGLAVPVVDLATYGVLSLAVLAIAVLGIVPTVALRLRR